MKTNIYAKIAFCLGLIFSVQAYAQSYSESFVDITTLPGSDWVTDNNSTTIGTTGWFQGAPATFPANSGATNGYIAANFNNTTGTNTISNWLITPNRVYENGDVFTFYTRTVNSPTFPDRLQVRLSTNGASTNCGTLSTDVGDFTTLLLEINPTLTTGAYPNVWTQYTITLSGLVGPTSGRIAFRYFVTGGGPTGANSDYIGIDDVVYTEVNPPANDLCSNPIALSACGTSVTTGTTIASTADADAITCGPAVGANGVWYTVVGNGSNITADLCTATYDTRIHVYTGSCGSFVCVDGNEDFCVTGSSVTWPSVAATTYTIFVQGNAGATGNFTLTLTTTDGTAPVPDVLSLPDVSSSCSVEITTPPTATDNCNGSIIGTTTDPLTYTAVGPHVVTWTFTDLSGNTSTQTQNAIVLADVIPPVIACLLDTTLSNTTDSCGAIVTYSITATDNCTNNVTLTHSLSQTITVGNSIACNAGGLHTDNSYYRVFDLAAMGVTANLNVTSVEVGIEQAIGATGSQPTTVNLYTLSGPLALANLTLVSSTSYTMNDVFNTVVDIPVTGLIPAGSVLVVEFFTPNGQITGNSIFVGSNAGGQTDPTYLAAGDCGITEPTDVGIIGFPGMQWVLNVNGSVGSLALTQTAGLPSGSLFPTGTTTNTFLADDGNGNTSTCTFTVTVNDDQAPIPDADSSAAFSFGSGPISVLCPDASTTLDSILVSGAPLSLNSGDLSSVCININHTWDSDLTISLISPLGTTFILTDANGGSGDNYTNTCFDMSAATNITTGTPPFTGSFIPEGAGGFDSFNGEDPNGYWKISIFDAFFGDQGTLTNFDINFNFQYPTLLEEAHVECSIAAPTAADNCDGALTATTSDPTSFTADGTYTVNWTYTDAAGNTATQSQTVIVDDVTAPVPDAASLPIVSNPCTATVSGVPTATDNCMGSITGTTTDALTYNVAGTYTVEWTYDDGRGNITTQTQTVIVTDNAPPVPNVPILPNVTGNCVVTIDSPPTATDGCTGTIVGTTTDPVSYNLIGTFFVIWTFDDGNGNIWTQNQTVVVSPCLGIEDEAGNWNAMVYPNPGSGIFTLTLSQIPTSNTEVRLVDALGQVLYAGMLTEQSKQFDFSHLASATYYLLINNNEGQISKPVIIRHND
jgi:subtilisin-like proprotein convertase family protein